MFAARQVCEKYVANVKGVFWVFIALEIADDKLNRHAV